MRTREKSFLMSAMSLVSAAMPERWDAMCSRMTDSCLAEMPPSSGSTGAAVLRAAPPLGIAPPAAGAAADPATVVLAAPGVSAAMRTADEPDEDPALAVATANDSALALTTGLRALPAASDVP